MGRIGRIGRIRKMGRIRKIEDRKRRYAEVDGIEG
jgi:hypothetical protein